jgi:hypothetical protein
MTRVDRFIGMGAILGGIILAIIGWQLDPGTSKLPGPGFFPLLIALTMAGLGIWLFIHPGFEEKSSSGQPPRWRAFAFALTSILCYPMVLFEAGYLCSTFALLIVQLRWVEQQHWKTSILIALIAAIVSLIVFRVLLKVPLPVGFIPLPKGW